MKNSGDGGWRGRFLQVEEHGTRAYAFSPRREIRTRRKGSRP